MEPIDLHPTFLTPTYPYTSIDTSSNFLQPALHRIAKTTKQSKTTSETSSRHVPPTKSTTTTSVPTPTQPSLPRQLLYHLHTLHLFTAKDTKTILVPQTIFGLINAYALSSPTTTPSLPLHLASRTPLILLWINLNLLPFCISNQLPPAAIAEDLINKPSRPLPSKRLTPSQAKNLMHLSYALALTLSFLIWGAPVGLSALALLGLGWLYNQAGWSEKGWVRRNLLTSAGYSVFGIGAVLVALGGSHPATSNMQADTIGAVGMDTAMWTWLLLVAAVVATTCHLTDMADLEGDRLRNRRTAPIVLGETVARWSIALPVGLWSVLAPAFWGTRFLGFVLPVFLGGKIVQRLLRDGEGRDYKGIFKLWNLWIGVLYLMPLMRA